MASIVLNYSVCVLVLVGGGVMLGGCGQNPTVRDPALDLSTAEMVTSLRKPLVFTHRDLRLSATGRDYLYLVPVETSRRSRQSLFVWVGLASTIDRGVTRTQHLQPTRITFEVDGQVLTLPLEQWHDAEDPQPVEVSLGISQSLRTALSANDFQWLAQARRVEISLQSELSQRDYQHWRGRWPDWADIDRDSAVALNVEVQ